MATINYETVFIAEPEISSDQVEQLLNRIKQTIQTNGGQLTAEDRWGRRRLAYNIQGHREGFYSVLTYSAEPAVVNAMEHLFAVTDSVIRHLTIRVIKKHKVFAPRRERPAGAAEGRPGGRPGSAIRHKVEPPTAAAAGAPAPASAPASESAPAPAAAPASAPAPEGKPA